MNIIIKDSNRDHIQKEIDIVQKRTKVRTISAADVLHAADYIYKYFGISKNAMIGIRVTVNAHAQKFAKAYKYNPESTLFDVLFKNGYTVLADVYRGTCTNTEYTIGYADLPAVAKEAILRKYERF